MRLWTYERLDAFLVNPRRAIPGTAMFFPGFANAQDRANVIAFLRTLSNTPVPLTFAGPAPTPTVTAEALGAPVLQARIAAADITQGEAFAVACAGCHTYGEGEGPRFGPNLYNIVAAAVGRSAGFAYTAGMQALNAEGAIWTYDRLDTFLTSPAAMVPGTRMFGAGIPGEQDRANVIAYLRTLSATPTPLLGAPQEGVYVGTAEAVEADVISVNGVRILLFGIDTVEPPQTCTIDGQPWECWPAAVRQLQTFLGEGPVTCTAVRPADVFRRVLALCEQGSGSLNERLVRSGFALAVPDEMPAYVEVEAAARAERIGLWQGRFQLPSEWREGRGIQVRRP